MSWFKRALLRKQRGQESQVRLTIFNPPMPFVLVPCNLLNGMGENDNKTAVKRPHGGCLSVLLTTQRLYHFFSPSNCRPSFCLVVTRPFDWDETAEISWSGSNKCPDPTCFTGETVLGFCGVSGRSPERTNVLIFRRSDKISTVSYSFKKSNRNLRTDHHARS